MLMLKVLLKNKMMKSSSLKIFCKFWNKYWICQKKKKAATVLLQFTPYSIRRCIFILLLSWLNVKGVHLAFFSPFFLTKYFRAKNYFFGNEKKYISKHFFYEKMAPILFIFYKKNILIHFFSIFQKFKFDLFWPILTFCDSTLHFLN